MLTRPALPGGLYARLDNGAEDEQIALACSTLTAH